MRMLQWWRAPPLSGAVRRRWKRCVLHPVLAATLTRLCEYRPLKVQLSTFIARCQVTPLETVCSPAWTMTGIAKVTRLLPNPQHFPPQQAVCGIDEDHLSAQKCPQLEGVFTYMKGYVSLLPHCLYLTLTLSTLPFPLLHLPLQALWKWLRRDWRQVCLRQGPLLWAKRHHPLCLLHKEETGSYSRTRR